MLANNITEKDIEKYHLAKVQGELVLPYSWNSHQFALFMLEGVKDKIKRSELRSKLYERFTIFTNAHQTIEEK